MFGHVSKAGETSDMVLGATGGQLAEKECVTSSKRTAEKGSGRATSEPALERPDTGPVASASTMEVTPPDEIERCKFWTSANVSVQTRQ